MADLGQSEFTPLFGYFINNQTATSQTLTLYYASTTSPNQRLFARTFSAPGWYSIGVANPTYARTVCDNPTTKTNNVSPILYSLNGGYSYALDFTDGNSFLHPNSPAVASSWKMVTAQDVNSLNDFRETKGYAVYITNASSSLTGFQNTQAPAVCDPTVFDQSSGALTVALDRSSPSGYAMASSTGQTVAQFDFTTSGEPMIVNGLDVNATFSGSGSGSVSNLKLVDDRGVQIGSTQTTISSTTPSVSYQSLGYTIPANTTRVVSVEIDLANDATGTLQFGLSNIQAQGALSLVTSTVVGCSGSLLMIGTNLALTSQDNNASTTVNAGQTNNLVGQFTLTAGNNPVKVTSLRFTETGSIPTQYLANLKLMNGSTQVGATLPSLNGNIAQFDLSNAPLMLASGQSATLSLYADVTGGVGYYFQFTVQQASDIQAVDMYNVGLLPTLTGGTLTSWPVFLYNVTVNQGAW